MGNRRSYHWRIAGNGRSIRRKGSWSHGNGGFGQKGGAVHIHCRIANRPSISQQFGALIEADALIGGDLLVSAGEKTLSLLRRDKTKVVCSSSEANSGEFALDRNFSLPKEDMRLALSARLGDTDLEFINAPILAKNFLGDTIYANVLLLGAAWRKDLFLYQWKP